MKLQEPSFLTAAIGAHEAASAVVALPDGAADRGRHMPAECGCSGSGARPIDPCELLSFQIAKQERHCAIEDDSGVAAGHHVPPEVLHFAQLVMCFAADRELYLVALGRKWPHEGMNSLVD